MCLIATFFDANGEELDLSSNLNLNARQSRFQLAIKFARLISKWGKRAWDYIYCVGASSMWRCGDNVRYIFNIRE